MTRRYTAEIGGILGERRDIPAPDIGTNAQVMSWIMDTYSMMVGHTEPGVVTGKPIELGGSEGRTEATGRGVVVALGGGRQVAWSGVERGEGRRAGLRQRRRDRREARPGERGRRGRRVGRGGRHLQRERPADPRAFQPATRAVRAAFREYKDAQAVTNAELLELPCDVLIPAAISAVIDETNAARVKARLIVEGANGPLTPAADRILEDKGAFVVPDILANSGGVVVSYFEWVQDLQNFFWEENEVNGRLTRIMRASYAAVETMAKAHKTDLRTAALIIGVKRVADATTRRGIFP